MHTGTLIDVSSSIIMIGTALRLVVLILALKNRTTRASKSWSFRIDRQRQDGSRTRISVSSQVGSTKRRRDPDSTGVTKESRTQADSQKRLKTTEK